MRCFLEEMARVPVAHVKVVSLNPAGASGAVVRQGGMPDIIARPDLEPARQLTWLVNARVALAPDAIESTLKRALATAFDDADIEWCDVECFSPSPPQPTHRYASRCAPESDAACCAAFYQRSDVRQLLGNSFHPGGTDLTLRIVRAAGLANGETVLDVACGIGESLRAIVQHWPVRAIGVDAGDSPLIQDALEILRGDAHSLPVESESVDLVLCECALSTFADQRGALREMRRVLRNGGRVAISDMILEGSVPESLREWVHAGTCLERALDAQSYVQLLQSSGFSVTYQEDESAALIDMLAQIKRRIAGVMAAALMNGGKDKLPFDARAARQTLREAESAVRNGIIGYGSFIATVNT